MRYQYCRTRSFNWVCRSSCDPTDYETEFTGRISKIGILTSTWNGGPYLFKKQFEKSNCANSRHTLSTGKFSELSEVLKILERSRSTINPGLERMKHAMDALGMNESTLPPSILIGGTNGKG